MVNGEIKEKAAALKVRQWQIAEELGMNECVLSRKLRHELDETEKARVLAAIQAVAEKRG